jgi:Protein of unknown function (DUF3631)
MASIYDIGYLLESVEALLRRYVVLTDDASAIVTLWVVHVFTFYAWEFTPYLAVTSAVKRSGKSRLLEILELVLGNARAVSTANISSASLYRLVDANPGTAVLFDEIDRIPKEKAEELWGLINSGWRLGGKVHRQTGARGDVLRSFSTFSPKVLAGIGQPLPDTTADRSLPVRMERRLAGERVDRLRLRRAEAEIAPLRELLAAWAEVAREQLAAAEPLFPTGMTNDRLMDVAEPLFAIADVEGGDWPARIRRAVMATEDVGVQIAEEELSVMALRHLYGAITETGEDRITTDAALAYMIRQDDGPWAEWWGEKVDAGKAIGPARRLRRYLERFDNVKPKQIRFGDVSLKGYELTPVLEAVNRYLPHLSETSDTTETVLASGVSDVSSVSDTPREGDQPDLEGQTATILEWNRRAREEGA